MIAPELSAIAQHRAHHVRCVCPCMYPLLSFAEKGSNERKKHVNSELSTSQRLPLAGGCCSSSRQLGEIDAFHLVRCYIQTHSYVRISITILAQICWLGMVETRTSPDQFGLLLLTMRWVFFGGQKGCSLGYKMCHDLTAIMNITNLLSTSASQYFNLQQPPKPPQCVVLTTSNTRGSPP